MAGLQDMIPLIRSRWQHWQTADDRSRRAAGFRGAVWEKRRRTVCDYGLATDIYRRLVACSEDWADYWTSCSKADSAM